MGKNFKISSSQWDMIMREDIIKLVRNGILFILFMMLYLEEVSVNYHIVLLHIISIPNASLRIN